MTKGAEGRATKKLREGGQSVRHQEQGSCLDSLARVEDSEDQDREEDVAHELVQEQVAVALGPAREQTEDAGRL